MTDETQITIEEAAVKMANELMQNFSYADQNQCWLLIKARLIADRERIMAEAKQAKFDLKKLH